MLFMLRTEFKSQSYYAFSVTVIYNYCKVTIFNQAVLQTGFAFFCLILL